MDENQRFSKILPLAGFSSQNNVNWKWKMSEMLRYRGYYLKVLSCLAKHSDWLNSLTLKSIPLSWSCLGCQWQLPSQKELARAPCSWKLYRLLPRATHEARIQPGRPWLWEHFYYFRHSISAHPFNKTTSVVCSNSVHKLVSDCVRW